MIYQVRHRTVYEYREPVSLSHHVLRLQPRHIPRQDCLGHRIGIKPRPSSLQTHLDYFGNSVSVIEIQEAHKHLIIESVSTVRTTSIRKLEPQETPSWEHVRDISRGAQIGASLEASEFLYDSPLIAADDDFAAFAADSFTAGLPIMEAMVDLTARIHREFAFDPDATTVSTPVKNVFKTRRGVCQDFAHLQIACLRSLGLPARYVSGYIETVAPPGEEKLIGADASHAWVSFYCPGLGWIDLDPTNNLVVSEQHITLGWGRDYSDVSPVRGVILGSGEHLVRVSVDVFAPPGEGRSCSIE